MKIGFGQRSKWSAKVVGFGLVRIFPRGMGRLFPQGNVLPISLKPHSLERIESCGHSSTDGGLCSRFCMIVGTQVASDRATFVKAPIPKTQRTGIVMGARLAMSGEVLPN